MNSKKLTILNIILIFLISFLSHYMYDIIKNNIIAVFFPVNESIFEHLKMTFTTYIIVLIIDYIITKNKYKNLIISNLVSSFITILLLIIIYPIIYNTFGENIILTLIIYMTTIIIGNIIGYKILNAKDLQLQETAIIVIIVTFIMFGILTFKPLHVKTYFYDFKNNHYGIN